VTTVTIYKQYGLRGVSIISGTGAAICTAVVTFASLHTSIPKQHFPWGGGVMREPPTKQFYPKCQSPRVLPSSQSTRSIAALSCIGSRPASRQSIRDGHSGAPGQ
jgi:hypothetical protein